MSSCRMTLVIRPVSLGRELVHESDVSIRRLLEDRAAVLPDTVLYGPG